MNDENIAYESGYESGFKDGKSSMKRKILDILEEEVVDTVGDAGATLVEVIQLIKSKAY